MNQSVITTNNNIFLREDDKLISLIKENFNNDDMQLFELNYRLYIENKNNPNGFHVNFDDVYKWIGFSTKANAKKLLIKDFELNTDYKMNTQTLMRKDERVHGGQNKEIILLTIECFKIFCFTAATIQSKKIYKYYIKMEDIITKYIENKHYEIIEENKKLLVETNNKLQLKD